VRVRVALASAGPQDPTYQAGDVDVPPASDGKWTASGVSVPIWDDFSWSLAIWAWLMVPASRGPTATDSGNIPFFGGGVPLLNTDCCADCTAGSAPGPVPGPLVSELSVRASLDVTVPQGKHAGIHKAQSTARLKWQVAIGGVPHAIRTCSAGKSLIIQGPGFSVSSKSVAVRPFSATFPGSHFGSTHDVVVT
jgi:hypothetical protein